MDELQKIKKRETITVREFIGRLLRVIRVKPSSP